MLWTLQRRRIVPGVDLSLDLYKAFDSIEWVFIEKVLQGYGLQSVVQWVKILYGKATGTISNAGFLSESFPIKRGVRQGDPLSPLLFVLAIECFA